MGGDLAPPPIPSSNQPDTKEAASDNTNSTTIGSDGAQLSIACFCQELIGGRGGQVENTREEITKRKTPKNTKATQFDLEGKSPYIKKIKEMK